MISAKLQLPWLQNAGWRNFIYGILIFSRYKNFPFFFFPAFTTRYFTEVIYEEHNIPEHTSSAGDKCLNVECISVASDVVNNACSLPFNYFENIC